MKPSFISQASGEESQDETPEIPVSHSTSKKSKENTAIEEGSTAAKESKDSKEQSNSTAVENENSNSSSSEDQQPLLAR